ncbi:hypothetical protein ACA910_007820 [Epithemia clementina (nom. ined.)]
MARNQKRSINFLLRWNPFRRRAHHANWARPESPLQNKNKGAQPPCDSWKETLSPRSVVDCHQNVLEEPSSKNFLQPAPFAQVLYVKSDVTTRGGSIITDQDLAELSMEVTKTYGQQASGRSKYHGGGFVPNKRRFSVDRIISDSLEAIGCVPATVTSLGSGRYLLQPLEYPSVDSTTNPSLSKADDFDVHDFSMSKKKMHYSEDDEDEESKVSPLTRILSELTLNTKIDYTSDEDDFHVFEEDGSSENSSDYFRNRSKSNTINKKEHHNNGAASIFRKRDDYEALAESGDLAEILQSCSGRPKHPIMWLAEI